MSEPFVASAPFEQISAGEEQEKSDAHLSDESLFNPPDDVDLPMKQLVSTTESVLKQIILVYSDHTFEMISPR